MPQRAKRTASRAEEFIPGVPNRDLDEDEYQGLDAETRKAVRDSGLWDVKTDQEMRGGGPDKPAPKGGD